LAVPKLLADSKDEDTPALGRRASTAFISNEKPVTQRWEQRWLVCLAKVTTEAWAAQPIWRRLAELKENY
jgi:hypothetical protein